MKYLIYGILFTHAYINRCSNNQTRIQYSCTALKKIRQTTTKLPEGISANIKILLNQK